MHDESKIYKKSLWLSRTRSSFGAKSSNGIDAWHLGHTNIDLKYSIELNTSSKLESKTEEESWEVEG